MNYIKKANSTYIFKTCISEIYGTVLQLANYNIWMDKKMYISVI